MDKVHHAGGVLFFALEKQVPQARFVLTQVWAPAVLTERTSFYLRGTQQMFLHDKTILFR